MNDKIGNDPYYIASNNKPTGFTVGKNIYIVAIPRRAPGVISTLNFIEENDCNHNSKSPKISGFPDYKTNQLTVFFFNYFFFQNFKNSILKNRQEILLTQNVL